jgi:hypothetical protein
MTDLDPLDELLDTWARWSRASASERRALWWPAQVPWAEGAVTNYSTSLTDSADYWDSRHSNRMRAIDAAIQDLPRRLQSVIYQTYGLGNLGQPKIEDDVLQMMYVMATVELEPRLIYRGVVI